MTKKASPAKPASSARPRSAPLGGPPIATSTLAKLREQKQLTQTALARELNMSTTCLKRAEAGQNVRVSTLMALAKYFDRPMHKFWTAIPDAVDAVRMRPQPVTSSRTKPKSK